MGEASFGKGSVQSLYDLDGGATLKVTIARWETPEGTYVTTENKLQPDVLVKDNLETVKDEILDKALR